MLEWAIAFFGMFFVDILHAHYIKSVQKDQPYTASVFAGIIYLLASFVTIGYVGDNLILIPACLGAAVGTFVGVYINKKYTGA